MPPVVVAVAVAAGAYAVGVGVASAIAIGVMTAVATNKMIKSMMPDVAAAVAQNQELQVGNQPPARVVVGETIVSGSIIKYYKGQHEDGKEYNHFFVPLALGVSESVEMYQLDGKNLTSLTGSGYQIIPRLGDQTEALPQALNRMPNVDESFVGFGVTDVYCEFVIDPDVFPNGVQDLKLKVKGRRVYDPRKDSTAGGSGTHRLNDENTWEWTDNAALVNFWWKKFGGSIELPDDMFDLANIAAEATICDELTDYIDREGQTQQQKRYTCNGVIDMTADPEAVEDELLTSCGGRWIESGGKYWLRVAAFRGPAVATITSVEAKPQRNPYTSLSQRYNTARCSIISRDHYYQATDMTPVVSDFLLNGRDRGVAYERPMKLLYTDNDTMSQRLAVIDMMENAAGDTLKLSVGPIGLKCAPGRNVQVTLPKWNINGLYEVLHARYNWQSKLFELELKETAAELYTQGTTPAQTDLTPNTTIDNTFVAQIENLQYVQDPVSPYRQGYLTWEHPAPGAVREYRVRILHEGIQAAILRSQIESQDINGLAVGDYSAEVVAVNRFDKSSEPVSILFAVTVPETPITQPDIVVLPGGIIARPPNPPHVDAIYEWLYTTDVSLNPNVHNHTLFLQAPNGTALHIPNPIHGATYYIWYRLLTAEGAGEWKLAVVEAVGLSGDRMDPDFWDQVPGIDTSDLEQDIEDLFEDQIKDVLDRSRGKIEEAKQRATNADFETRTESLELELRDPEEGLEAVNYRINQVALGPGGQAISMEGLALQVLNSTTGLSATFQRVAQVEIDAYNNAEAIEAIEGIVEHPTTGLNAAFARANQAWSYADGNAGAISVIQATINDPTGGLEATAILALSAKQTADGNTTAISGLSSSVSNANSKATSALNLATALDDDMDEIKAVALLSVDANGNVAQIKVASTPDDSIISFKAADYVWVNPADEPVVYWDTQLGLYAFKGALLAERADFINGLAVDFNGAFLEVGNDPGYANPTDSVRLGWFGGAYQNYLLANPHGIAFYATSQFQTYPIRFLSATHFSGGVKLDAPVVDGVLTAGNIYAPGGGLNSSRTVYIGNNLNVAYDLTVQGTIANFTGAHILLVHKPVTAQIGDLMVRTTLVSSSINETLFWGEVSSSASQRGCIGAYSGIVEEFDDHAIVKVNAVGEGMMKVCAQGGDIDTDDLLILSDTPGVAMRQPDDIVRGTTVAKVSRPYTFANPSETALLEVIYLCG
ncbi:phage tail protein [Bowmanella dokdonensis]|uniref:Tip attachment protein J domain-containing protein n=1 Tax=Bowmanella dokdonensis TaxID=751969 RepID=A0A939DN26_9ALTE|nr:hypothetical protein [Bowmanella dokdonensis]MBN7824786.1 hypothetical protein [Bowmanella dokdonensis]